MAKLRDERFLFPGGFSSDNQACLDIIMAKQLPNAACNSILFRLISAILRQESSEALRRRYEACLRLVLFLCLSQFLSHHLTNDHCLQAICTAP